MIPCKYCREPIDEAAKKCKKCNEPFYLVGKILKFTPLLSAVVAVASLGIAFSEIVEKQKAARRADVAEKAHVEVSRELNTKEKAADQALREMAQRLPAPSRDVMIKDLQLPQRTTLKELEQKAKSAPADAEIQRQAFLYRALKGSEG